MNKLLEKCLTKNTKNHNLQERIIALQKKQAENKKNLNEFALKYIRQHFPEKLERMIEPKNLEDKQFFVYHADNKKFEDSFRNGVYHEGVICFSILFDYEEYQAHNETFYEPIYYQDAIYVEDLPEDE